MIGALRLQNIDELHLFINNSCLSRSIDVQKEVQQLENSVRQFISMDSSPSTTFDRQFEIQADLQIVGSKPSADIYLNLV